MMNSNNHYNLFHNDNSFANFSTNDVSPLKLIKQEEEGVKKDFLKEKILPKMDQENMYIKQEEMNIVDLFMDFSENSEMNNNLFRTDNFFLNNNEIFSHDYNNSKNINDLFKLDPILLKSDTEIVNPKPKKKIFYVIHMNNNKKNNTSFSNLSENTRKRGKYKMYNANLKNECLNLLNVMSVKQVAKVKNIPIKSLKRWITVGANRKKGGGRKVRDPDMEMNLYKWYKDQIEKGYFISSKEFKAKANELSKCKEFKASKGWLEKLKKKYGLVLTKSKSKTGEIQLE